MAAAAYLQHRLLRKRANDDGQSALVILIISCNLALINALFSGQASGRNSSPARRKAASVGGNLKKQLTTKNIQENEAISNCKIE